MISKGRHGARRLLLQALYQQQIAEHSAAELLEQFADHEEFPAADGDYFKVVLADVLSRTAVLDDMVDEFLDRPVSQLDPIERALLWVGAAELSGQADVPANVIINEAVELAKEYGAQDSYRYINAVLDKAAGALR